MVKTIIHGINYSDAFRNICLYISQVFPLVLLGFSGGVQWLGKKQG